MGTAEMLSALAAAGVGAAGEQDRKACVTSAGVAAKEGSMGSERVRFRTADGAPSGATSSGPAAGVVPAELRSRGVVFEEYDFPGLKTEAGIASTGECAWPSAA